MKENHPWKKVYNIKSFEIITQKPSVLVEEYKDKFNKGDNVLDIGCGNGRNSLFLASLGCNVDCFDVADLNWLKNQNKKVEEKIHFQKTDIENFKYEQNKYKSIIVSRVIQYLNENELNNLIKNIQLSLTNDGFLLLSYTSDGGIFNQEKINVPKYKYSIDKISNLLKESFNEVLTKEGSKKSESVNYRDNIKSYDIFATDKK